MITENEMIEYMLKLVEYLCMLDGKENRIDVDIENLHMSFEAWTD